MEDQERLARLTPREREIYHLRTEGYSKRMIANELHIPFHQVEEHLEAMRAKLGDDPYLPSPLDRLGLWDASIEDQEHLHLLTPRERDVWEVWRKHPDWSKGQIGREVYLPPHVVRRYLENIKTKLAGLPPLSGIEVEVLDLLAEGMNHADVARSIGIDERTVAVILRRIEQKRLEAKGEP